MYIFKYTFKQQPKNKTKKSRKCIKTNLIGHMCMCYFKPEFAQILSEKKLGPLEVIFPLK